MNTAITGLGVIAVYVAVNYQVLRRVGGIAPKKAVAVMVVNLVAGAIVGAVGVAITAQAQDTRK